jgi:hypothetical protein
LDAETAFHLAMVYKAKAKNLTNDLQFWGQYLPPSHINRLEIMRSTFETMKAEMKRLCANGTPDARCDQEQILRYVKLIEEESTFPY